MGLFDDLLDKGKAVAQTTVQNAGVSLGVLAGDQDRLDLSGVRTVVTASPSASNPTQPPAVAPSRQDSLSPMGGMLDKAIGFAKTPLGFLTLAVVGFGIYHISKGK